MDRVSVVLVEPLYAGNLGSVARVMGNFGLQRLVLVNPAPGILEASELEAMARTAAPLARRARVTSSLRDALSDVDLALGFTTRLGKRRRDTELLRDAVERLSRTYSDCRIAAVFGREDTGLSTAELQLCHWLIRIPTHRDLPSCNLSQAVGLFCYEMAEAVRLDARTATSRKVASVSEMEGFYDHFEDVLQAVGFIEEANPERMMNEVRRIFSRRLPDPRDVRILRGILSKVQLALDRTQRGLPPS